VVVGKPTPRGLLGRLRGSPVDAIVLSSGEIDVYVVSSDREEAGSPVPPLPPPRRPQPPSDYAWSVLVVGLTTLVAWAAHGRLDNSNIIMLYLLGVAFVASRFGRWPSALAAALSVAAFDFFYVYPYLTFAVGDTQYVVTFAVMLLVALLISTLAVRVHGRSKTGG
jgi:two-component system sensor histidine kinase KdpD